MVQFLFLMRVDYSSLFFVPFSCVCFKALNKGTKSLRRRKLLVLPPALLRLHRDFVCILTKTKKKQISKQYLLIFYSSKSKHFPDHIKTFQSEQNLYIPKYNSSNTLRSDSISSSREFLFSSGINSAYCFAFSRISA